HPGRRDAQSVRALRWPWLTGSPAYQAPPTISKAATPVTRTLAIRPIPERFNATRAPQVESRSNSGTRHPALQRVEGTPAAEEISSPAPSGSLLGALRASAPVVH